MDRVREEIKEVECKAEKFEIIEGYAPELQEKLKELEKLQFENMCLREDFTELVHDINQLYIADKSNDISSIRMVYDKLKIDGYIRENGVLKRRFS